MSKLINKTRLQKFAEGFWTKIKGRYDNAFVDAEIPETEKKIKFTKAGGGATKDVSLEAYARLQDKNDFEKDVTSNIGMTDNTLKYGRLNGNENPNRTSGHRNVTTKAFVDGYIDHIVALADATQEVGESSRWNIWCVTKGETRNDDRVFKKIDVTATIRNQVINGAQEKVVDLPIKTAFTNETYFLVRCENKRYKVVDIKAENQTDDVVNISEVLGGKNSQIPWRTNVTNNISVMFLVGRESIKSLSEKLDKVNADGGLYVKQDEVSVTSEANKVVRLDGQGKLDKTLLPKIAINEYYSVGEFSNNALANVTYENGDVVVVATNGQVSKRYLCINKRDGVANSTDDFIELNSKDGSVVSVNARSGAITLDLVSDSADNKLKLKIAGDGGNEVVKEIEMISEQDITEILDSLPQ